MAVLPPRPLRLGAFGVPKKSERTGGSRHEEVVNTNAGGGSVFDGGSADCGAVEEMEVWPSGVALRGEASNHPQLHWLKTVVVSVVGKGAARSRQVRVGKMSDGRKSSAVDVSKAGKKTSKPGSLLCPGMSLGVTRLLPRRRPAYRQHEPDPGSSMERVKASPDTVAGRSRGEREGSKRQNPRGAEYRRRARWRTRP